MPRFYARRVEDIDSRFRQVEEFLEKLSAKSNAEEQGAVVPVPVNTGSVLGGDLGDLDNVDDGDADEGYIPVYVNGSYVVQNHTPAHFGFGEDTPTARVHIGPGEAAAEGASLKIEEGTLLATAELGAMEFASSLLHFTLSGTTRRTFDFLPVTPPTYVVTNDTEDRTFDANATTLDEIADIVGTIIADLQAQGRFQ